jgi:putative ABC transport system permease protein
MTQIVDQSLTQRRLTTILMAGFSALALVLAAVGMYGVVAYGVTQRMREFGIRIALGSTPREVVQLVLSQELSMALTGAAVGIGLAIGAGGVMRSLVYAVATRDVLSVLAATLVLFALAAIASYIPARRAAAVDPGVTLKAE